VIDGDPSPWQRAGLYDDGEHGDLAPSDRTWAGTLSETLAPGTEIEFYLECEDVSGALDFEPARPESGDDVLGSADDFFYHFAMPEPEETAGIELSEIVAINNYTWIRPDGSSPDYIEIRNTADRALPLDGLMLTDRAFEGNVEGYTFPDGSVLQPSEYLVVAADGVGGGLNVAPFKVDSDREQIALARRTESGLAAIVDMVDVRRLGDDEALFRAGSGGEWWTGRPTRNRENVAWGVLESRSVGDEFQLLIPVGRELPVTLESSAELDHGWEKLEIFPADGIEQMRSFPLSGRRFFRTFW
jgi:hypothetical protein